MKLQVKLNTNINEFEKLIDEATELLIKIKDVTEKINNFELKANIEKDNNN